MTCACWRDSKVTAWCCRPVRQRYLLSFMCGLAMLNSYTMRLTLNIAITVMVEPRVGLNVTANPGTCPVSEDRVNATTAGTGEFSWTQAEQGMLLSSFFWIYWMSHLPGGLAAQRWGGKSMLLLSVLGTALLTIASPVVVRAGGIYALLVLRVLEGALEGPGFPAVNVLIAHWSPPNEKSFHGSLAFSGALLGTVLAHATSGMILHASGNDWALLFYFFGGIALLWCLFFWLYCASDPWQHPFITPAELEYLDGAIKHLARGERPKTPWLKIIMSLPVIALIVGQVGHDFIFFGMITDLPKYMHDVQHFTVMKLGFFASLPYLSEWVVALAGGWLADQIIHRGWMSIVNTRRMFASTSSMLPSLGIVLASFAECDVTLVMVSFTLGLGIMGTFYPGMKVNALDLSPNFAGILMAFINGLGALAGIVVPVLIGALTPDSTLEQWRVAFYVIAGVTCTCNAIFCLLASGSVQSWNDPQPSAPEAT